MDAQARHEIVARQRDLASVESKLSFPQREVHKYPADGISVVVPSHERVGSCRRLLRSLKEARALISQPTQVIVVDSSSAQKAEELQNACREFGAEYHTHTNHVSAKRNHGAKLAMFGILLFIDDDCEATPALLEQHFLCYGKDENVVGVLGLTEFVGPESMVWRAVKRTPFLSPFRSSSNGTHRVWGPSNNLSIRRSVFADLGGFDESFPKKPGAEDVDLGYRLMKAGRLFHCNPEAVVLHGTETWNTFWQMMSRTFHWGRGQFFIYLNHGDATRCGAPSTCGALLLIIPASLAAVSVAGHFAWLALPAVFLGLSILHCVCNAAGAGCRHRIPGGLHELLLGQLFLSWFKIGLAYESIRNRWVFPLFRTVAVEPEEMVQQWNTQLVGVLLFVLKLLFAIRIVGTFTNEGM